MKAENTLPVFSLNYYINTAYITFGLLLPGSFVGMFHKAESNQRGCKFSDEAVTCNKIADCNSRTMYSCTIESVTCRNAPPTAFTHFCSHTLLFSVSSYMNFLNAPYTPGPLAASHCVWLFDYIYEYSTICMNIQLFNVSNSQQMQALVKEWYVWIFNHMYEYSTVQCF